MLVTTPWSDVIAFSPDRWDSPSKLNVLMTKFADHRRVFFVEEPVVDLYEQPFLKVAHKTQNLMVATPCLPKGLELAERALECERLLNEWMKQEDILDYTCWYFTPAPWDYARDLEPEVIVYHRLLGQDVSEELLDAAHLIFSDFPSLEHFEIESYLLQEQEVRESLKVPTSALLNAKRRGTLVARLS